MTRPSKAPVYAVEDSHDRLRVLMRRPSDGGTPPIPAEHAAPFQDPVTGRIVDGRAAAKRRRAKAKHKGFSTLDPAHVESWLSPHVRVAIGHGVELQGRFPDAALAGLVGATADAFGIFRALVALGGKGDAKALSEARAWLREYRACLRELSALAGLASSTRDQTPPPGFTFVHEGDDQ